VGRYHDRLPRRCFHAARTQYECPRDIVGFYFDTAGNQHGFVLSGGTYASIDVPLPGTIATRVGGINSQGQIVGSYDDNVTNGATNPNT
jgi:hypothetical protein